MFGSDIIRVRVRGYLKNITENEIFEFDEKGIKIKNKITYNDNNVKCILKIDSDKIFLKREGNDFINAMIFEKERGSSNYFLKNEGYDVDIDILVKRIDIDDKDIFIEYEVVSSGALYEYKLEVSEIL